MPASILVDGELQPSAAVQAGGTDRPEASHPLLFCAAAQATQHHQLVVLATLEDGLQPGLHITHLRQQTGPEEAVLDVQAASSPVMAPG